MKTKQENMLEIFHLNISLKEIILKYDGVLYLFIKSNIWQLCKKQEMATLCKFNEYKKWRHKFLKVGTLTEFERRRKLQSYTRF